MNTRLPSIDEAKRQARRLRGELTPLGADLSHARALELVAHQHGYRDWNTFHAAMGNGPPAEEPESERPESERAVPAAVGERVRGTYLAQPFTGRVVAVSVLGREGAGAARYRVEIDFAEPVDVVTFDSFSSFRKRVTATLDRNGVSVSRTSDGEPHMRLLPGTGVAS